jgi:hypothetical protein
MKRVYRAELLPDVGHWKNVLELRGIPCQLRHAHLASIVGELPWLESWPELWVMDDRDEALAMRIIRHGRDRPLVAADPWICTSCGEYLEGQFTTCWSCGDDRMP